MTRHIPNLLTLLRLALAPAGAACLYLSWAWAEPGAAPVWMTDPLSTLQAMAAFGMAAFFIAAATDWLDGFLARRWDARSRLGEILDPIADKALVILYLVAIALILPFSAYIAVPVFFIAARDLAVTALRLTAGGAGSPHLQVSVMAKIKTALEMAVIATALIVGALGGVNWPIVFEVWILALWAAAALSLQTGWDYWRNGRANPDA